MEPIRMLQLSLYSAALGAYGWGMIRLFRRTTTRNARTRRVGMIALASAGFHLRAIVAAGIEPWRSAIAIAMYVLSLSAFWWTVRTCRQQSQALTAIFDTDTPAYVLQNGPYHFVRHPFYVSYALFWLAGWVASGWWSSAISAVAMITIYARGAMMEEAKFRASPLAGEYASYCRRTGFMFPRR